MMIKQKCEHFVDSLLCMRKIIKTLIGSAARDIETNSVFTLLETTSVAVENLIPSSGITSHFQSTIQFNYIILISVLELSFHRNQLLHIHSIEYEVRHMFQTSTKCKFCGFLFSASLDRRKAYSVISWLSKLMRQTTIK